MSAFSAHMENHAPSYVALAAVLATVAAGWLHADSILDTGRAQARSTVEAARTQADGLKETARANERIARYGELVQASHRVRFLMERHERLGDAAKRDPGTVEALRTGTDELAAKAASAAVILGGHPDQEVRKNAHGIAFTLPHALRCLETGLPGNDTNGYRVDYPGRGLTSCTDLRSWLAEHESKLAENPPALP
ncbi:hypothetical protein [Streptomyces sp. NPDC090022]|uniref:hypothetical protein n=1 Tax=Streptomyces sp. NPDC090022 TaxID=3365920 RepID=UPI00380C2B17